MVLSDHTPSFGCELAGPSEHAVIAISMWVPPSSTPKVVFTSRAGNHAPMRTSALTRATRRNRWTGARSMETRSGFRKLETHFRVLVDLLHTRALALQEKLSNEP